MRLRFAPLALVLVSALAHAASLERLREFVRETQTARASFIQTVTDRNGRMVQRSTGELAIARPGRFRWTLEKPYQQILVGDGEKIRAIVDNLPDNFPDHFPQATNVASDYRKSTGHRFERGHPKSLLERRHHENIERQQQAPRIGERP